MDIPTKYIYFKNTIRLNKNRFSLLSIPDIPYPVFEGSNGILYSPTIYFKPHPQELLSIRDSNNFIDGYFSELFELENYTIKEDNETILITLSYYLRISIEEPTEIENNTLHYGIGDNYYEKHSFDIIPTLSVIDNINHPPGISPPKEELELELELELIERIEELKY